MSISFQPVQSAGEMLQTAKRLGIPESRVYATGSNEAKIAKVKELGITTHYDNNPNVVRALPYVGVII
jgi:soluble P-type ATPase